jgi:hypothetical protein
LIKNKFYLTLIKMSSTPVTTTAAPTATATAPTATAIATVTGATPTITGGGAAAGGAGAAAKAKPSCPPCPERGNYDVVKLYGAETGVWCHKCNQPFFIPTSSVPIWVKKQYRHIFLTPRQLEAECEREEQALGLYKAMIQETEEYDNDDDY